MPRLKAAGIKAVTLPGPALAAAQPAAPAAKSLEQLAHERAEEAWRSRTEGQWANAELEVPAAQRGEHGGGRGRRRVGGPMQRAKSVPTRPGPPRTGITQEFMPWGPGSNAPRKINRDRDISRSSMAGAAATAVGAAAKGSAGEGEDLAQPEMQTTMERVHFGRIGQDVGRSPSRPASSSLDIATVGSTVVPAVPAAAQVAAGAAALSSTHQPPLDAQAAVVPVGGDMPSGTMADSLSPGDSKSSAAATRTPEPEPEPEPEMHMRSSATAFAGHTPHPVAGNTLAGPMRAPALPTRSSNDFSPYPVLSTAGVTRFSNSVIAATLPIAAVRNKHPILETGSSSHHSAPRSLNAVAAKSVNAEVASAHGSSGAPSRKAQQLRRRPVQLKSPPAQDAMVDTTFGPRRLLSEDSESEAMDSFSSADDHSDLGSSSSAESFEYDRVDDGDYDSGGSVSSMSASDDLSYSSTNSPRGSDDEFSSSESEADEATDSKRMWVPYQDAATGETFEINTVTKEVRWVDPEAGSEEDRDNEQSQRRGVVQERKNAGKAKKKKKKRRSALASHKGLRQAGQQSQRAGRRRQLPSLRRGGGLPPAPRSGAYRQSSANRRVLRQQSAASRAVTRPRRSRRTKNDSPQRAMSKSGTVSVVGTLPALEPPRAGSMPLDLFDDAMKHYHLRRRLDEVHASIDTSAPIRPCWHHTRAGNLRKMSLERERRLNYEREMRNRQARIDSLPSMSIRETPVRVPVRRRRTMLPSMYSYC
jgi:hypothetical protein